MPAKVCILTTVHPPFDTRIFHKEAKTLVGAGYDVTLIAQHDKNEVVDGVKIIALTKPRNRFTRIFGLTWRVFRLALRQRADIYHFHDPELLLVGVLLKAFTKGKVVYDVHEDYSKHILVKRWIYPFLRRASSYLMNKVEMFSAKYFDAIITPTGPLTSRFREAKRALTIYNFPPLELFKSSGITARVESQSDIIHVGTLTRSRLSFFLSVGFELKKIGHDFKWVILGIPPDMITWAENRIRCHYPNMKHKFILLKKVPHTEVVKYLTRSRIGVFHHAAIDLIMVALPVKLFEYMACGLPVVSSDLPLIRKFVGDKNCASLVTPDNVEEFAYSIDFLLNNPEKAKQMGSIGKKLVQREYNWAHEAKKLLTLYKGLLRKGRGGTNEN